MLALSLAKVETSGDPNDIFRLQLPENENHQSGRFNIRNQEIRPVSSHCHQSPVFLK